MAFDFWRPLARVAAFAPLWARFVPSLGLLLTGIGFMKDAVGDIADAIDLDVLRSDGRLQQSDISSLLNANRESYSSCRALVTGIAVFALSREQMATLESLPGSVL